MTELEKMQRAKMYIDKLANGVNPIDDISVSDSDIINNVRISRCLFYVSDILQQVIENGGVVQKKTVSPSTPFFLTEKQKVGFIPSDRPISVSELTKNLNDIADLEKCAKLKYSQITGWLVDIGALEIQTTYDGKNKKAPTTNGIELGITTELRHGMHGEYYAVVYNKSAQQFIVDNLDAITSFDKKQKKYSDDIPQ